MRRAAITAIGLVLSGCATAAVPEGQYGSAKGYRVQVPSANWRTAGGTGADLELRRDAPPGGIVVDATCEGPELRRPMPRVLRHLTFGFERRRTVERAEETVGGLPAAREVVTGTADGAEVSVEAVSVRGPRCIYDFLYVAPADAFEAGRSEFRRLVESLAVAR